MYNQMMPPSLRIVAAEQFQRWHARGKRAWVWSLLTGRRNGLLNLAAVTQQNRVHASHNAGLRSVPLAQIRGSEGRSEDFDGQFRPLKTHNRDRWIEIATAHLRDMPLPPVDLVQINDSYFVRDGHHRISVARMVGQREIDAQVTVWSVASVVPPQTASESCQAGLASHGRQMRERLTAAFQWLSLRSLFGEDVSVQKV